MAATVIVIHRKRPFAFRIVHAAHRTATPLLQQHLCITCRTYVIQFLFSKVANGLLVLKIQLGFPRLPSLTCGFHLVRIRRCPRALSLVPTQTPSLFRLWRPLRTTTRSAPAAFVAIRFSAASANLHLRLHCHNGPLLEEMSGITTSLRRSFWSWPSTSAAA